MGSPRSDRLSTEAGLWTGERLESSKISVKAKSAWVGAQAERGRAAPSGAARTLPSADRTSWCGSRPIEAATRASSGIKDWSPSSAGQRPSRSGQSNSSYQGVNAAIEQTGSYFQSSSWSKAYCLQPLDGPQRAGSCHARSNSGREAHSICRSGVLKWAGSGGPAPLRFIDLHSAGPYTATRPARLAPSIPHCRIAAQSAAMAGPGRNQRSRERQVEGAGTGIPECSLELNYRQSSPPNGFLRHIVPFEKSYPPCGFAREVTPSE